jgi:hypothetical protein
VGHAPNATEQLDPVGSLPVVWNHRRADGDEIRPRFEILDDLLNGAGSRPSVRIAEEEKVATRCCPD